MGDDVSTTVRLTVYPRGDVALGVTNGTVNVSLTKRRRGALADSMVLSPDEAIELGTALLCAAQNVRAGVWGGPTDDIELAKVALS